MIKIKLPDYGFFAIVNYAIDCMLIAKNKNLDIAFEWKSNLYGNPDQDCWSYYFENNRLNNNEFSESYIANTYISKYGNRNRYAAPNGAFYKYNGGKAIMDNTNLSNDQINFIKKNLIINKKVLDRINLTINKIIGSNNEKNLVGFHLRGYGRLDGGSDLILLRLFINFKTLFGSYLKIIKSNSENKKFFVATDSKNLLSKIQYKFKNQALFFDFFRSEFGENHLKKNFQNNFEKGENVLLDVITLSKCSKIICSPSNIRNFLSIYNKNIIFFEKEIINFKFKKNYNFFDKIVNSLFYSLLEKIRLFNIKYKN